MGFLTKKKTITDLNFIELFTPDTAYRQAKFETYFSTQTMAQYNDTMFRWKKDYRGRYKERYLERAGLEPTSNATRLTVDRALLLGYIKTKYPEANKITSSSFIIPSISYVARLYLQENYGVNWSNYTDTLAIEYNMYKMKDIDYSDPEDDTKIVIYFENIDDQNDKMEINLTNGFHATTCINVRYELSTDPLEWFIYIEKKSTISKDIYIEDDMTMTAIIPLKEDNILHKDSVWTKRMLNKLGVGGNELSDQLEQEKEIDNAYIFTGLRFDSENKYMAKALYQTFQYLHGAIIEQPIPKEGETIVIAKDNINFGMSKMNLSYDFDMKIETKSGIATGKFSRLDANGNLEYYTENIKPGDYYSKVNENSTGTKQNSVLTIRYQLSPNTYNEMTITNYVSRFTVSGFGFTVYLDSEPEDGRLILPLDVMNGLKFKEWIAVHDRSFTMLAYSHKVVKIKWYQQSWFSWVIRIGLAIFTGGASLSVDFLIDLAISYAISWGIGEILKMIDSEILMFISSIALTALGASITSGFDISDFTVENYLPLATKAVKTASNIYQENTMNEIRKLYDKSKEEERKDELLEEEMNSNSLTVTKAMMDAHYSHSDINNPEAWVAQQLGFGLYNFDQYYSVSEQIDIRVNVKSG